MSGLDFKNETFGSYEESVSYLPVRLAALLGNRSGQLRILDIGCGAGAQALLLAQALPNAHVTGVDVSPMNIRAAREAALKSACADRVSFEEADYFEYHRGPWDAILSDSTLHLIPGTERLFGKISGELAPGGLLAATVPHRCPYNALLLGARRVYRAVDAGPVRWGALKIARLVYPDVPMELLSERLGYMRVLPHFQVDAAFLEWLASLGLGCLESRPLPRLLGKPAHSLYVFATPAA